MIPGLPSARSTWRFASGWRSAPPRRPADLLLADDNVVRSTSAIGRWTVGILKRHSGRDLHVHALPAAPTGS